MAAAPSTTDVPQTAEAAVAVLDEASSKPPAGVVLPPRDIRLIVEKTAGYVARNGESFEERVRQKERRNPKFSFLLPLDEYYGYYAWRLGECKAGRGTTIASGRAGDKTSAVAVQDTKPKGPEEPGAFEFSAKMPNINAQDLDVLKLTAQYVAKNGRSWAAMLSQRQSSNAQFDFLRPSHSLYGYYSRLIDQYTSIINGSQLQDGKVEKDRIAQLEKIANRKHTVLDQARIRANWSKHQESEKVKQAEENAAQNRAYVMVNWQDFVICETLLFPESDEQLDFPRPISLSTLQNASLEQKALMSLAPPSRRIEEAMPTDKDFPNYTDNNNNNPPTPHPLSRLPASNGIGPALPIHMYHPPSIPLPFPVFAPLPPDPYNGHAPPQPFAYPYAPTATPITTTSTASPVLPLAPVPPSKQVLLPPTVPLPPKPPAPINSGLPARKVPTAECYYCKQQIPLDEMTKHLQIEMRDSRASEQQAKAATRKSTNNLVSMQAADNLKRFASNRPDIFDPVSGQAQAEEEIARVKKAKSEQKATVWGT